MAKVVALVSSGRYRQEHYEDVAALLRGHNTATYDGHKLMLSSLTLSFSDLFAADNPKRCTFHGDHDGKYSEDCKVTGFDRAQFLIACGLSEQDSKGGVPTKA